MRRALVVGIDGYAGAELATCCADAVNVKTCLEQTAECGTNWVVTRFLGRDATVPEVTRTVLLDQLERLFDVNSDDVLFYFSGHVSMTPWGAELCTQDGLGNGQGVPFTNLMALANTANVSSVTIILDWCYSGDLGTTTPGIARYLGRAATATLAENVVILASTHERRQGVAGKQSPFTACLVDGLNGGAADKSGRVTAFSLFDYLSEHLDEKGIKPQLKANCTDLLVLRKVGPGTGYRWLDGRSRSGDGLGE